MLRHDAADDNAPCYADDPRLPLLPITLLRRHYAAAAAAMMLMPFLPLLFRHTIFSLRCSPPAAPPPPMLLARARHAFHAAAAAMILR